MKGKDFVESEWYKKGANPKEQERLKENFQKWKNRVTNVGILDKAGQLWNYFCSNKTTPQDKILIAAALIYIVAPIDFIPDLLPVIGWIDDIGIAGFALNHLNNKLSELALEEKIEGIPEEIMDTNENQNYGMPSFNNLNLNVKANYKLANVKNIAQNLNANTVIDAINEIKESYIDLTSNIVFVGRYSTGKTSLINSLLKHEWMATSDIPTTKALTYIFKGTKNRVYVEKSNGLIEEFSDLDFLKDREAEEYKSSDKIAIQLTDMGFLPENSRIIDTPGLEDPDINISEIAYKIVPKADAVIFVLDLYAATQKNLEFLKDLLSNDKQRKLFTVINKIDEVPESEIQSKLQEVNKMLTMSGLTNPKIYPLSAKLSLSDPENKEFKRFKNDLLDFILTDQIAERQRLISKKEGTVIDTIEALCKNSIEKAEANIVDLKIDKEKMNQNKEKMNQIFRKKKELTFRKIESCKLRFQNSFDNFLSALEIKLHTQIDSAELMELKNTDLIADFVKTEIISFIDKEKNAMEKELQAEISSVSDKLNIEIENTFILLNPNIKPFWLQQNKEFVVPAMIVLSFPFMGFFSWLPVAIFGLLGRAPIESLMESIGVKVGITKVRDQLKSELKDTIGKLKKQFSDKIEDVFDEIKSEYDVLFTKEKNSFFETNFADVEIDKTQVGDFKGYLADIKELKK
jgi:uncharacterized membrane protein YkvA (DUF1232 family)/GTPase SAR1 family protein